MADERENTNTLVLAGPGSGKTRVLVHRIAYLIRAKRQNPQSILALAYNRHAAIEIRRRLHELVGQDALGVMVLTCHSLAMRLMGASFSDKADRPDSERFQKVLKEAAALLRGEGLEPEEAEESRARLLAGFRWILVDEYQDIGPDEHELISALAGRTLSEADAKLTLFAVGDDDQNIYAFKGSSVRFIREFEHDYDAKPAFLIENYRSTRHIIEASNAVIAPAADRMKADNEIRINRARVKCPLGGQWGEHDPVGSGRVQILPAAGDAISQAQIAMDEMHRLSSLAPGWDWSRCAIIAREWTYLDPVRSLCELRKVPVHMANEDAPNLWHIRETQALLNWLNARDSALMEHKDLRACLSRQRCSPWIEFLEEAVDEHEAETGASAVAVDSFREWLAEWGCEVRRRQRGLLLLSAHRAKGLEFDHVVVLDGGWGKAGSGEDRDASRRLYYVAMTRARQTLSLGRLAESHPFLDSLGDVPAALWREPAALLAPPTAELSRCYRLLSLRDIYLSFAGRTPPDGSVHQAIADLSAGDRLQVKRRSDRWQLLDAAGVVVGTLAASFVPPANMRCTGATVSAVVTWRSSYSAPEYLSQLKCDKWEVVLPEMVFEPVS